METIKLIPSDNTTHVRVSCNCNPPKIFELKAVDDATNWSLSLPLGTWLFHKPCGTKFEIVDDLENGNNRVTKSEILESV